MTTSTARVLALLEILQGGGTRTVPDLAARLGVDERTVRRYAGHLLELGVPVESVRGRYGGYRIAPGYRMPPLMLTDEEALAVLLGLLAARRTGLVPASAAAGESAAAKLRRVLPKPLGRRLSALLDTAGFTAPARPGTGPETDVLLGLAEAALHRHPVEITYTDRHGRESERTVLPYGLVAHLGHWYLTAGDPGADDGETRTFRLDRIAAMTVRPGSFDVPRAFDPVAAVQEGLARTPWRHEVSLRVRADVGHVRAHLPAHLATVSPLPDTDAEHTGWVRVRIRAERLEWIPPVLAALDRPFVIERPTELRVLVQALADRLHEHASAD
ncbi:helix-turn-helix transcriptional regulator [Streptomyces gilvus]|uniref:helix-turn-helix transcriptional regulator n=1 Tax=Streptomyces gilvus TaxID=2920937 RepID=UPI001F10C199|nr:WYL domain-containing protein [Streptomyces sp. CME 23]MCH5670949.1 WYL domain-containing protein [Streptomyces sp. CME 23]